MVHVAEEGLLSIDRAWFSDTRTPSRRMAVSSHPAEGIIVVSFWQAGVCRATFRLPLAEGARLISAIAGGMASGLPVGAGPRTVLPRPPWWRRWFRFPPARPTPRQGEQLRVVR